ncbi:MAG: phosphoribosylanthranilate isomerase [Tsuneonella suprasediminis]|uniref:N-(5'-phosphoribosyl)anthranilate isomerase n=1 Tax=Tsuneonella suprasediminis TaxID=2306996 RepID=A0A419QZZ3_9SPHN|nr:phosphoribosylanthranilate isomerase [Tsuneonella suprasediminis]RJX66783.1 phosphoribosylanthranilate isomerase [Tsuneonella suprasediminis]UBS32428.1 phosphoribosylanthranilate isomerase [Altererythrobacter sp. N1]
MPDTMIKICGLKTPEAVDAAVDAGATHIGLVHFEPSPRHVSLSDAAKLRRRVPDSVKVVLLLVNMQPAPTGEALDAVQPDVVQFHGNETPEWLALVKEKTRYEVWKAWGLMNAQSLENVLAYEGKVDRVLYDAPAKKLPGGNGVPLDWSLLREYHHRIAWGLAGGLTPDNVVDAIRATGAPLVDASSGLESAPGVKDIDRIAAFCRAVREA